MDALTTAAFDSLVTSVLPKLVARLGALGKIKPAGREPNPELAVLIVEANELLSLLSAWAAGAGAETPAADDASEDPEAMAMLGALEEAPKPAKGAAASGGAKKGVAPVPTAKPTSLEDELSDDEAAALLASMDSSETVDTMEAAAEPASEPSEDMSDDEAKALLAAMDAPAVDDARNTEDMSDDEAQALLAAMDAPAATADQGDMSDDEAKALLAAMDAPVATSQTGASKPTAPEAMSADDEALAMLRSLGGAEEDHAAPAPAAPVKAAASRAAAPAAAAAEDEGGEDLQEVEEFGKNDFASDPDMINDFLTNTDELMETLDQTILQLEQNPKDRETIESIFRAAHTLKGASGMFGLKAIERVMHRMENLFDQVRKGVLVPDSNTIDVVFQGLDVLRTLLGAVKGGKPSGIPTVPIVKALELAATGRYVKGSVGGNAGGGGGGVVAEREVAASPAAHAGGGDEEKGGGAKKKSAEQSTIRVDLERLDALVNLVGELVIDRTRFASIEENIRTTSPQLKVAGNMTETVQLFGRHMNEIHEIVMKIRMVPIGNVFNKYTRIVRDLSRQLGKEIELYIDGESTELDKTIVEQIGDPLIHLIRNSCDHGVEMPDARVKAGKRKSGSIFLSARQEGNHIIITIQDDGKGIPVEAIRKKAIERGLITEDMTLAKRDIYNLIFEPGFSTAEKVTNISGRGVGMDVVRKQISKLKGLIDIDSEPGKGTTTIIRLPLTLAIMQSLLIESAGEIFAIPLSTVVESVRIKPEEIQNVGETEVIKRHGRVLPLLHLHEILDLAQRPKVSWYATRDREAEQASAQRIAKRRERLYVVIVGTGDRRFGIVVDQLLNQQEMVIKSLGPILRKTECVAGGAVLGNGEVVLVIDIQELEDRFRSKARSEAA